MNNLLQLKGRMLTKGASRLGAPSLPAKSKVSEKDVLTLAGQLDAVRRFWAKETVGVNPLVSVHYTTVVAKSNRIRRLLADHGRSASHYIVGAKFEGEAQSLHHVIIYCVNQHVLDTTLQDLRVAAAILEHRGGSIDSKGLKDINEQGLGVGDRSRGLSKSAFAQIIRDVHYVDHFDVDQEQSDYRQTSLITLYNTGRDPLELLHSLGIDDVLSTDTIDRTTIRLLPKQYEILKKEAPYLIAMSLPDTSDLTFEESESGIRLKLRIPDPMDEPTIGVIDTRFDETVYFSDWVDYHDELDPRLPEDPKDFKHGTEVSSIIVDGPSLNPALDDGCGRFKVRHFAVAINGANSSFSIVKTIQSIVAENQDIKVWNMCLGSILESPKNFISPEGALLDELQSKYDVTFVVAGTNVTTNDNQKTDKRIGSPADSINSIVVNAVTSMKEPASYSRCGPVLDFYRKPDIAYFGGDKRDLMAVYSPGGVAQGKGTSFSAPWIARKMAFLIQIMGMSRESAKALLIDCASGWSGQGDGLKVGYGIVPTRIEDILQTPANEIRFVIEGTASAFETYNYEIPVPAARGKYQYMAKATLCYFPKCNRAQGVDYTDTELDFHFGRMTDNDIKSLDHNVQGELDKLTYEQDARKLYRKWDNVKHIGDITKSRFVPKKAYGEANWGFKIRRTGRQDEPQTDALRFAMVVTLKEMQGRNRIDDFIQRCSLRHWFVNEIDINAYMNLYQQAEIDIDFDDEA